MINWIILLRGIWQVDGYGTGQYSLLITNKLTIYGPSHNVRFLGIHINANLDWEKQNNICIQIMNEAASTLDKEIGGLGLMSLRDLNKIAFTSSIMNHGINFVHRFPASLLQIY